MATVTEMRAWLREQGEDVPARGRLRPDLQARYDQAHPAGGDDDGWDLPGGGEDDEDEPQVPLEPERPPLTRTGQRTRARARAGGWTRADSLTARILGAGKKPPGKPAKKKPRVSLEKFTTRIYSSLGRMVRPLSPAMSNCLQAQAAMAGVLLEDMAQGTIIDRLLQGPARAEDKLDKGVALIAPPVLCLLIEQSFLLPPREMAIRQALLMPMLRESLRIGLEVSESYADQIKARLEQDARWDQQIDELLRLIFSQVASAAETVPEPEMAGATA